MITSNLLAEDRIICNADVTSKKRALEVISELFCNNSNEVLPSHKIFEALINREKLGSTGLGKGIAIPHARISEIDEAVAALVKLKTPVDYDAIDSKPVDILFALLVPEHYTDEHLQVLAELAETLSSEDLCSQIRSESCATPLHQILLNWKTGKQDE
ncbi:MAG: PTS IIA-like nitrogen-regulatory protein PtsN [Gammaproteobacteria bacterium]|nr:MAG: PTS IIA-like nitrogen-regulatory protein PtsN [Gammaproteobacteria bacterium]